MGGNSFGKIFKVTTFGESHGNALGCIVEGIPAGVKISTEKIQRELERRRPGKNFAGKKNAAVTSRDESDTAEILSGVFEGFSEGTPIAIAINPASTGSINPKATPPRFLNHAAAGVIVPKFIRSDTSKAFISTQNPSIRKAIAIRMPPPTTNGSIWDTPFISWV